MVAGHVIECGTQATGGNYSFFTEVAGLERAGLPVGRDRGRRLVGDRQARRHRRRGHRSAPSPRSCSTRSAGPAYLGPDVTARFDTIAARAAGARPRAHLRHAGRAAARRRSRCAMNELGRLPQRHERGPHRPRHRGEGRRWSRRRSGGRCPYGPDDFAEVTTAPRAHRQGRPGQQRGGGGRPGGSRVKDPDERKVGRAVSDAMIELALATHPRLLRRGRRARAGQALRRLPPGAASPPISCRSTWSLLGGERDRGRLRCARGADVRSSTRRRARRRAPPGGPTTARRRSGWSSAPARATRAATPTSACSPAATRPGPGSTSSSPSSGSASCCPRRPTSSIDRHPLPNLWSLNFVIHGLLQAGRRRVDPPGRPGQEPRRVAAGPRRRHPGRAARRRT